MVFPEATDFPPGSMPWLREVEKTVQEALERATKATDDLAAYRRTNGAAVGAVGRNAGLALGMLNQTAGDAPTVTVESFAYYTESGHPTAGLNISWEYTNPYGGDGNDDTRMFEIWTRPTRPEPAEPTNDTDPGLPAPDRDSQRVTTSSDTYTTVWGLECLKEYAVKVKVIGPVGPNGSFSDEVFITTPAEPDLRDIGKPSLAKVAGGVAVTWGWSQPMTDSVPPTDGIDDTTGFTVVNAALPLASTETIRRTFPAPDSGKVYIATVDTSTKLHRGFVVTEDGTVSAADFSDAEVGSTATITPYGLENVYFAQMPDGNLYGLGSSLSDYWGKRFANFDLSGPSDSSYFIFWKIDTATNTLSHTLQYFPSGASYSGSSNGAVAAGKIISVNSPAFSPKLSFAVYDYVASAATEMYVAITPTSKTANKPLIATGADTVAQLYGSDIFTLDVGSGSITQTPVTGIPAIANATLLTMNNSVYAWSDGILYSLENGGSSWDATAVWSAYPGINIQAPIGSPLTGDIVLGQYWRGSIDGNGIAVYDTATATEYRAWSIPSGPTPGPTMSTWPIEPISDTVSAFVQNDATYPPVIMDGGAFALFSATSVSLISPTFLPGIPGDPGSPSVASGPATPWPEVKGILIERLTTSGWLEVGSRIFPGTILDPAPAPGTYQYRFVPVGVTNQLGAPTESVTISI